MGKRRGVVRKKDSVKTSNLNNLRKYIKIVTNKIK